MRTSGARAPWGADDEETRSNVHNIARRVAGDNHAFLDDEGQWQGRCLTKRRLFRALMDGDLPAVDGTVRRGYDLCGPGGEAHVNLLHQLLLNSYAQPPSASLRYLVEHGIDPNAPDAAGWAPLHYVARLGSNDMVQDAAVELLRLGAMPDQPAPNGDTPLIVALKEPPGRVNHGVVARLIEAGAAVDRPAGARSIADRLRSIGFGHLLGKRDD